MYRYRFKDKDELLDFVHNNFISSDEVCELLGISKQYLSDLIKTERIKPIITHNKYRLFYKPDMIKFDITRRKQKK